jgi:hypothetical protein
MIVMTNRFAYLTFIMFIIAAVIFSHEVHSQNIVNLSNNAGTSENPAIDSYQQKRYVVWADNTTGAFLIYFSIYDEAWSVASAISSTTGGISPRVATDAEDVIAVWQSSNSIYYAEYDGAWTAPSQIPQSNGGAFPDIDVEENKIYVVWEKSGSIYFCQYDTIWNDPVEISNTTYDASAPRIVVENGMIYAVWYETLSYSPLVCEIYYVEYDGEWSEPLNISNFQNSDSGRPSIDVKNGIVEVVWDDDTYSTAAEICYSFYDGLWSTPFNISNTAYGSLSPSISVADNAVQAVWYEYASDNFEIIYSEKTGSSWSVPVNISNTSGWSWFPEISCDEDSVNVVWSDNTPSHYDIYFTCLPSGQTGIAEDADCYPDESITSYNSPNPFNSITTISYAITLDSPVELSIYNIEGNQVYTSISACQNAGDHSIVWDGKNSEGTIQPGGIYFYLLKTVNVLSETGRMVLVK